MVVGFPMPFTRKGKKQKGGKFEASGMIQKRTERKKKWGAKRSVPASSQRVCRKKRNDQKRRCSAHRTRKAMRDVVSNQRGT